MKNVFYAGIGAVVWSLFASMCAAQSVWPPLFASSHGNAVMNAPFTVASHHASTTTHCCVVLDASTVPFPVGTVLNRISLRRDGAYPQSYAAAAGQLTVRIGSASAPPGDLDDVRFARLFVGEQLQLAYASSPQTPFVVPAAAPPVGPGPAPFTVVIPFQNAYTWNGGPLALEFLWTPTAGSSAFRVDAVALPRRPGRSRTIAAGCTGSNGFEPTHFVLPETTVPGAILRTQLEGMRTPSTPSESVALHLLGVAPGGPGFPLATLGGVPGCFVHVDPLLLQAFVASNPSRMFARAVSSATLPAQTSLTGVVLRSQWLCFDTAFGAPLPLTASDAQDITLGPLAPPAAPRSVRTWWRYGSVGHGYETGRMVPDDYGPVLQFN